MSMRTDDLYLVDLLEAADAIARIVDQYDYPAFARDDVVRSAVLWKLYTISEASTKLAPRTRARFVDVAWDRIRGLRNRMAHGYFTLKWDEVWEIATESVPALHS